MKGATADPLASTRSPPSTAIISTIGISQYFLRASRNSPSSRRNDMASPSILLGHGAGRRRSLDPVRPRRAIERHGDGTLAEKPHQEADGRHHDEEHRA